MAALNMQREPVGIVVHDAAPQAANPRIMMWFWANENDVPEWERE